MRRPLRALAALGLLLLAARPATAIELDYRLEPQQVAPDTYVLIGATEDFDFDNGGNIVNTAFVVTSAGVVVIDTGPSRRYGEQLRTAIARITDRPIERVLITHHHPDHFFGNQAFADVPIQALPVARNGMQSEGGAFADNLYMMAGAWMEGTEPLPANGTLEPGLLEVGDHRFRLVALRGHTAGDLVILDETTRTLFSGDLVFDSRTLTTPHADVDAWLASLDDLAALDFDWLVPGHGPVREASAAHIQATADHLRWLTRTLRDAAALGLSMAEAMQLPIPEPYASLPLAREEFTRSVVHLYPAYEAEVLPRVDVARP